VNEFLRDLRYLSALPASKKHDELWLEEYPFDLQLLTASRLYRASREMYLELGGTFAPRLSSMMRSLSAQDLFKDEIDYTPSATELAWFRDHHDEVAQPQDDVAALSHYNEISLFHEQNHRVIWRMLPPPPKDARAIGRYLNFAESLVVMLDLALGDELGAKTSTTAERMKVVYRTGATRAYTKKQMRESLVAIQFASYCVLEEIDRRDLLKAVNYVLPGQAQMNKNAVKRSLDINELFTRVTNPEWQKRNWKTVTKKLAKFHTGTAQPLELPQDPLDLDQEFAITRQVLAAYGL